jgi:tRNA(fMet)-specific endonuclease VapC
MKYLLDTNICIALIRQKPQSILQRLISQEPGDVGISSITLAELFHGVEKSAQPEQNMSALEQFLLPLVLSDFDQNATLAYGRIRADLERNGKLIGSMDMLIAAHALSLDAVIVTNNMQEFQRVKGLVVEDWIPKSK